MYKQFLRLYQTIKHLKWVQIKYRVWYFLRNYVRRITGFQYDFYPKTPPQVASLVLQKGIDNYNTSLGEGKFEFLNIEHHFEKNIQWDFAKYGKLWSYNLNYFDFLNQRNEIPTSSVNGLLEDFVTQLPRLRTANEPFPIALRVMNWVKYFSARGLPKNQIFEQSLYAQIKILEDNLEFHLLGNHLLENAFALLMGGAYFQNVKIWQKGMPILIKELEEQILEDGAHFELCPMYHNMMLFRVLDCINILKNNTFLKNLEGFESANKLLHFLTEKAALMLGWMQKMTYEDGSMPHFGDSTEGIAPTSEQLLNYAHRLDVRPTKQKLGISGYRRLKNERFDLIAKVGNIGPDYIPGHAHADSLSFELRIDGKPFLVDTGISTYEKNNRRQLERSTQSHNTVCINHKNSSDVWGGFRVGKRSRCVLMEASDKSVRAKCSNGHERDFILEDTQIKIVDKIQETSPSKAFLFFAKDVYAETQGSQIITQMASIKIGKQAKIRQELYCLALGYNQAVLSNCVMIDFKNELETTITIA